MMQASTATRSFFSYEPRPYRPRQIPAVSVVGLSRPGFDCLAGFARRGHRVVGVDPRQDVLAEVALGRSGLGDDQIDTALTKAVVAGRLTAVGSALGAVVDTDATFIVNDAMAFSARDWLAAMRTVGIALRSKRGYHLVVLVGAIAHGVTRRKLIPELERASGKKAGRDFGVCVQPILDPASGEEPAILGVSDNTAAERFADLHGGLDTDTGFVTLEAAEAVPAHA
jgi:GDP-mannose 6-dehydrogenase